jgi:hypothetical protein
MGKEDKAVEHSVFIVISDGKQENRRNVFQTPFATTITAKPVHQTTIPNVIY